MLRVLLMQLHSPQVLCTLKSHTYILVKPPAAVVQYINACMYDMYVRMYTYM